MHLLSTVVLLIDLPSSELKRDDVGAVVGIYEPDGLEVEFVTGSGRTQALVTLNVNDVRPLGDSDILTARLLRAV